MGLVSDPQVSALSSLVGSRILKPQTTPGFLAVGLTLWVRGVPTMAHGQKADEGVCSLFAHGQPFSHARVAGGGYFSKEAMRERGAPAEHGGGEKEQVELAFLAAALATAEEQWLPGDTGLLQWWETSLPGFVLSLLPRHAQGWVSSSPFRPSPARVRVWDGKAPFPGLPEVSC